MSIYLRWLEDQVRAAGASLSERSIESLEEIREVADTIVNCTGLGARDLCHDDELFGVRGQIVVVEAPAVCGFLSDAAEVTYIIPRLHDVVLGGTAEEHVYDTRIDEENAASIRERCARLVPLLASAPVRMHRVGIRPCRTTVRLERETRTGCQ